VQPDEVYFYEVYFSTNDRNEHEFVLRANRKITLLGGAEGYFHV